MAAPPSPARQLWKLAAPVVGLNVLNVLSLAVDTALCGRLPNKETVLAALGYSVQLLFLLQVFMFGLSIGAVALVARAYGATQHGRVQKVMDQAVALTVIIALGIAVVGNLLARSLVRGLGGDEHVTDEAMRFLRPLLTFTILTYLILLFAAVLRGVGNTALAFKIALLQNVLNVVINSVAIHGAFGLPGYGVPGAAWGTVASQAIATGVLLSALRRGAVPGVTARFVLRLDREVIRQIWRIGAPAGLDMIILNASFMSLIALLGYIDDVAVGAHGIGLRVQSLAFVPGLSVAQATGALVGQALGAGDPDHARRVYRASVTLCVAIMGAVGFIITAFAPWVVQIFDVSPDTAVGAYAVTWMRVLGFGTPLIAPWVATSGLLQGAGATQTSLRINLFATFLVQMPASAILGIALGMGPLGVWLGLPIAAISRSFMGYLAFRRGAWARTGT